MPSSLIGVTQSSSNLYHPLPPRAADRSNVSVTHLINQAWNSIKRLKWYSKDGTWTTQHEKSWETHIDAGGVMPSSHVSIVVANGIQAIMAAWLLALVGNVWWQIQISGGEVNECLELVSCELSVREPFEVDYEDFRQPPEIQFLHGLLMLLATRAVPD